MKSKKIKLAHGIAVVPEDFIIVDETISEKADYAGILACRQAGFPHYVSLLEKPVTALTEKEEDMLCAICKKIYPEIRQATVGLFAIPDVEDEAHLYLGTGIIRKGE